MDVDAQSEVTADTVFNGEEQHFPRISILAATKSSRA